MSYSYEFILNTAAASSVGVFALAVLRLLAMQWSCWGVLATVFIAGLAAFAAFDCQFLSRLRPCDSLSWKGFLRLALYQVFAATLARYAMWDLTKTYRSRSAMRAKQEATLMQLVRQSRDTVFGKDHRFATIQGIDDYRAYVPVHEYADLDRYNQLAYQGQPNVYFPGPVEFLCKTSGTTGKNKTFPGAKGYMTKVFWVYLTTLHSQNQLIRNAGRKAALKRQLAPVVQAPDRENEFGVPIGPMSKFLSIRGDMTTTPDEALEKIHHAQSAFYIHVVFALWHEEIGEVNVFFPTTLITFLRSLSTNWESVLTDIKRGSLNPDKVEIDADLLNVLNQRLSPKPERAAQLRALFGDGQDLTGFFAKAWPGIPCILLARSGSFQSSYRYLKKYLGDIPTYGSFLGGTEGFVGINLTIANVDYEAPERYHPLLSPSFVEFVPVDANGSDIGEPKLAYELEVGSMYETVLTSYNCFRLRSGDVIKVVEMDHCAPVFEISHRKSHILSVHVEKTTEKSLQAAVMQAANSLACQVVDFSAADCFLYEPVSGDSRGAKYYVMFLEVGDDRQLSEEDMAKFDPSLRENAENYDLFRGEGHIDPMLTIQVKPGAFAALRQRMMQENPDISQMQFKMPRVLRKEAHVQCLLEHRL